MFKSIKKFRSNEDGNVAIIFGMAVVPFLMAAGMAVDYGRGVVAKHELQVALDSAVLAAGSLRLATDADRKALGKAYFEANFDSSTYGLTVPNDLISINNNVISADQSLTVKTKFMQVASLLSGSSGNNSDMELKSDATALVPQIGSAEIALVLDYSGSMSWYLNGAQKYVTMRNAAKDLISDLGTAVNGANVEFALVPFSYGVKASLMNKHVTDTGYNKLSGVTRQESCFSGRKRNATTDTEPADGKRHRWQQLDLWYDTDPFDEDSSRAAYCPSMLPMRQLTNVTGTLLTDLNTWTPTGGTHISSGFQFGWHAISPNSVFPGGATYDKIDHVDPEQRVMKAIVLLTDGAQTVPAYRKNGAGENNPDTSDPSWPMDKTNGEYNLEQQCINAKAEGIIIVTVAFDLNDVDTINRLDACASPKDASDATAGNYAFNANTTSELQTAFKEIGDILADMVYLSN